MPTTPTAEPAVAGDGARGGRPLVVVESPAKAKTIAGFLGKDFVVESSIGHIRDLPRNAADVPAAMKGEPWARLGVDVDNDFKPLYIVSPEKKQQVAKLKALLKNASELYLATDEDREGESIAWHLLEVLNPRVPVRRMVFHEITRKAIQEAVANSRDLDRRLVDAQETRRILDRLYGYEVSPVLWKKVMPKLSAGRVQSVATRVLVERERARMRFRTAGYWDLDGTFAGPRADDGGVTTFAATLVSVDGRRVATGKDFGEDGALKSSTAVALDERTARSLAESLAGAEFAVRTVEEKPFKRSPYPPFMTSTLQQEAGRKLRFSAQRAMQIAQRLYENGYITYMRTDSTTLSETALTAARSQARSLYGDAYVPAQPRQYVKKVKNAQEAHEAIRPAGDTFRTPEQVSRELGSDELRLYELIWKRTVASQMSDATGQSMQVRLGARSADGQDAEFAASGKVITFPGFLRAYVEGADDPDAELEDREVRLPPLAQGDALSVDGIEPKGHVTQPPARFTEASLVKTLEEMGVGRPSTYASIIGTIQDRGYVWKKGTALVPSFIAFAVIGLLERHFEKLVDYGFTASLEDDLDEIANGRGDAIDYLQRFYFGDGISGLKAMVSEHLGEIDAREVNSIVVGQDADGVDLVVRVGRYGPYLQRGEDRASVPEDLAPDELTVEKVLDLLSAPSGDRALGAEPGTGFQVVAKAGRYGPYVTTVVPEGTKAEARTASLFKDMSLDTIDLDTALKLLTLPRVLGSDPADGAEIIASNGRYGPYIKKGTDFRSIDNEDQLFTITLDEAVAIYAQPKQRRGQRAAAAPLRELGNDPVSDKPIVVKEGRFGPYVTDGETNASLRKEDSVEQITTERAAELIAERRERGPSKPKKAARKAPAKKAAAKKTAAKKAPAKRTAAKKAAS
ncbi:MAG TPA: type I DNA topoisomerase [Mycobacteriales bacterium]|nr:type I DNA topoisomerase [Mycobacteriales bacterium]